MKTFDLMKALVEEERRFARILEGEEPLEKFNRVVNRGVSTVNSKTIVLGYYETMVNTIGLYNLLSMNWHALQAALMTYSDPYSLIPIGQYGSIDVSLLIDLNYEKEDLTLTHILNKVEVTRALASQHDPIYNHPYVLSSIFNKCETFMEVMVLCKFIYDGMGIKLVKGHFRSKVDFEFVKPESITKKRKHSHEIAIGESVSMKNLLVEMTAVALDRVDSKYSRIQIQNLIGVLYEKARVKRIS